MLTQLHKPRPPLQLAVTVVLSSGATADITKLACTSYAVVVGSTIATVSPSGLVTPLGAAQVWAQAQP